LKTTVAICAGGDSPEEEISLKTARTVFDNLDRSLYEVILVKMRFSDWEAHFDGQRFAIDKNDFSFEWEGNKIKFDYVFIAIHGTPGEDGKLQAYFDLLKIPYSSPDHIGSTLTFNKWYCNTLLRQLGYRVSDNFYIRRGDEVDTDKIADEIGFPCFVKPCSAGSSYGISKVKKSADLMIAITQAFEYDHEVMVEKGMAGKEMTCGVYKKENEIVALPITQIIPNGEFFDYAAKYQGDSQEITPARISPEQTENIQQIAREIYRRLNLRGIVRVDFMLVENDPYIIEINAVPGMSAESLVPQQVSAAGISLQQFYTDIINATNCK
jgi:D-alanine-D-alanine ligase